MLSFWERDLLRSDVIIVGGGITGMSAAVSLLERQPSLRVTILERSVLPYGASSRNAGFACFGSLTEILSDIRQMGEERARGIVEMRYKGLMKLRQRLGDAAIGFDATGGFELIDAADENDLEHIPSLNKLLHPIVSNYIQHCEMLPDLNAPKRAVMVRMEGEGQVNTAALMQALEHKCLSMGARIRTGSHVLNIQPSSGGFVLQVKDDQRGIVEFKCLHAVVCTNGFANDLIPNVDLVPGRGQVLVTEPINGLRFRGNLHMNEGFYYLRNVGNRILFGGGRNLDFAGEQTNQIQINEQIQNELERQLGELFPQFEVRIKSRWAGIMAFGSSKEPIVRHLDSGVLAAVRLGGMGVALATEVGDRVAEILLQ